VVHEPRTITYISFAFRPNNQVSMVWSSCGVSIHAVVTPIYHECYRYRCVISRLFSIYSCWLTSL